MNGHDAPITSAKDDLLNGLGVARAIHRVLTTTPPDWSTRVGLYGPWGSGKTSILNLLRTLEEADGALVISFSAWSATDESGVIAQFYETLASRLREASIRLPIKQRVKATFKAARRFEFLTRLSRAGAEELAPTPPLVTKAATEALSNLASAASTWAVIGRKDLEAIATLLKGRRVVVFIDDLDRADPRAVPKTLLAMRELLDWPGFAFVLAFDKGAIASALSEYSTAFGNDAQGFLEKVIDVPFEVPDAREDQRKRLAETAFKACCDLMPANAIAAVLPVLPSQPRRVKLIARMMGALRPSLVRHGTEEVDWAGLGLYLIVKEASQAAADWIVKAKTVEGVDWVLWAGDKDEKDKKEEEAKGVLLGLLSAPKPPPDAERVVDAALRLLRHWDMASANAVLYWVGLAYREPSITSSEFNSLRKEFADQKHPSLVDAAIRRAATNAGCSQQEAAAACLAAAVESYRAAVDAMAEAGTQIEWAHRYSEAQKSLLLLEHLWSQKENATLATASVQGPITATLLGVVGLWLTWTKNEGELALRQRERCLVLAAVDKCADPELLYEQTDPFWNSHLSANPADAAMVKAWRVTLRDALAPRVVARFCEKFARVDGLVAVSGGGDKLGAWLVENKESPLYTQPELTQELVKALRAGHGANEPIRVALSKNARLYLEQILFQTRDASWGGVEDAKAINAAHPDIIPAAWAVMTEISVPYRMRASLRKLRADLIGIGVAPALLPEPPWLAEEGRASVAG
jgi:hypothetical protein